MPRFMIPRVAHCDGGQLPMTTLQAWILIVLVGVVALAALVGLLRK